MLVRKLYVVALLTLGCLAVASEARAQYTPYYQPSGMSSSPYMGLIGSGNNRGMTQRYLSTVQPQLQARQAFQAQNAQIQALSRDLQSMSNQANVNGAAMSTGHVATYMNYSHYFPGLGGPTGGRSGSGSSLGQKLNKPSVATSSYRR